MNKMKIALFVFAVISILACKKEEKTYCDDMDLDLVYSIEYVSDSQAKICYSNASNNVPSNSSFRWEMHDGYSDMASGGCTTVFGNGQYAVSLTVTTPDGIMCSTFKEFDITDLK